MRRAWPLGVQLNLLLLLVIVPFLGAVAYQYRSDVAHARENAGEQLRLIARLRDVTAILVGHRTEERHDDQQ